MIRIAHASVFVALMAAAGCQHLAVSGPDNDGAAESSGPVQTVSDGEHRQLIDLLDYYERTADMDEKTVRQRLAILEAQLASARCSAARIRFAMLLTRLPPGEGTVDGVLAPCITDPRPTATAEELLAPVLRELLAVRDARAETHAEAQALQNKLAEAKAENGKLRQQIEGLKAIEESVQERTSEEE